MNERHQIAFQKLLARLRPFRQKPINKSKEKPFSPPIKQLWPDTCRFVNGPFSVGGI